MINKALSNDDAKREIVRRLKGGEVFVSPHFRRAALADGLLPTTAMELIPAAFAEFSEFVDGSWRYRLRNGRFVIVVALGGGERLNLVTFFKK